jgi:hypothetical protein
LCNPEIEDGSGNRNVEDAWLVARFFCHLSRKIKRFAPPLFPFEPSACLAYQRRSLGTYAAKSRAIWEKQFTNGGDISSMRRFGSIHLGAILGQVFDQPARFRSHP